MKIGIVGLGLIGGSFALAYSEAGEEVLGFDLDKETMDAAFQKGAISSTLTTDNIAECDLVLICVCPDAAISYLEEMGPYIGEHPIVLDCCGTKRKVCAACFPISEKYNFTYLGSHPMAGTHNSGFKYARSNMYHNAPMVIVPPKFGDMELLDEVKTLLEPIGFSKFTVTSAEAHDEMIAFTSQLCHIVSNAYIKSPTSGNHKGFSAGSYKDLTRVAWLNPQMWAELFMDNKDFLLNEMDIFIKNMTAYRDAMIEGNESKLIELLDEGRMIKAKVDGRS